MTRYLLDTNILSDLVRQPQGKVKQAIEAVGEASIFTSIVVAGELRFGAAKKASERLTIQLETILDLIPVLPLEAPADLEYGRLRAELEAGGVPIGGNDMLIAAHALATDAILVTDNEREFRRINRLKVENWLRAAT